MSRGRGFTTQQMIDAPHGATYVWCNGALWYPQTLARKLHREDLVIRPLSWLQWRNVAGYKGLHLVLDHAARPDPEGWVALEYAQQRATLTEGVK